ncbi:MAG: SGNH/GDSL hydrolase family protein [Candidatus Omnitrophica bacterium]|nr:SGNH/GDSL hydrolase family protein [Candidatus Omnitrophota bacterium]
MIKKIILKTSLLFASLILICLFAEITLRIFPSLWKNDFDENQYFQYTDIKPGQQFDLRMRPPNFKKETNTFRIVALGDSYTWGGKIKSPNDIWTSVLERNLNRFTKNSPKVEVINLAISGFTTVNELEMLEAIGWRFSPDLIIVQYTLNDPLPSAKGFKRLGQGAFFKTKNIIANPKIHELFNQKSYFYSFLNHRIQIAQRKLYGKEYQDIKDLYNKDFYGWENCVKALAAIASSAQQKNVPAIFMIFPSFESGRHTRKTYPYSEIHDRMTQIAIRLKYNTLDLLDDFIEKGKDFKEWRVMKLDGHPNPQAHSIAAEAILKLILEKKLITSN